MRIGMLAKSMIIMDSIKHVFETAYDVLRERHELVCRPPEYIHTYCLLFYGIREILAPIIKHLSISSNLLNAYAAAWLESRVRLVLAVHIRFVH